MTSTREKSFFSHGIRRHFLKKKKKSPGYYQVKHSGNIPAENQIKEKQVSAGGRTIFAFPQNK